ncbi:hypothetical protein [Botryobacter ruber]|uniref:hypothetical protein n=1 Tax=Botryobacter ruber TaxID=2171629 RepID=UPI000E0B6470|nr:hypothetical protein [Botryobacter ruber]
MKYLFAKILFILLLVAGMEACTSGGVAYRADSYPAWYRHRGEPRFRYYYFPRHQLYFDFSTREYLYHQRGNLFRSTYPPPNLPDRARYRGIPYTGENPFEYEKKRSNRKFKQETSENSLTEY